MTSTQYDAPGAESEGVESTQAGNQKRSTTVTRATDNSRADAQSGAPFWHQLLADSHDVPAKRLAFVAVVEVATGKYRRRPYLTLAAAQRAVERAEARGVEATLYLAELRPLAGGR